MIIAYTFEVVDLINLPLSEFMHVLMLFSIFILLIFDMWLYLPDLLIDLIEFILISLVLIYLNSHLPGLDLLSESALEEPLFQHGQSFCNLIML